MTAQALHSLPVANPAGKKEKRSSVFDLSLLAVTFVESVPLSEETAA